MKIFKDIKRGFGFAIGIILAFGILFSTYAFVEPTLSPTSNYVINWLSPLNKMHNDTNVKITRMYDNNNPRFYLAPNGVTVKCQGAIVGERGFVNGVLYTKRPIYQITVANAASTCTSGITHIDSVFAGKTTFNEPIDSWDTSSVTSMIQVFNGAVSFNQPINHWDVSSVTNMMQMFYGALAFNQNLGAWNTGSVLSFFQCSAGATSWSLPHPPGC